MIFHIQEDLLLAQHKNVFIFFPMSNIDINDIYKDKYSGAINKAL